MPAEPDAGLAPLLDELYRGESRRILATLIRLLGDFDLAEDGLHDAFAAALEAWRRDGVPASPRAWLISTGRFKAIDRLRRRARLGVPMDAVPEPADLDGPGDLGEDAPGVPDDQLRLIFTCCHPALAPEASAALTLREVCGLTTEAIASAFLISPSTLAQRIVRAKARIREARIPYEVPDRRALPERLDAVLRVIYLVFNEGYAASSGPSLTRPDLSAEAIRLGRLLLELIPDPEAMGLLALMLLHESRRPARTALDGELVLLEDQDRSLWDRGLIEEGRRWLDQAMAPGRAGPYALQAAIAAVHAGSPRVEATDWTRIIALYRLLGRVAPSPVVGLNHAVAVAMRDGPLAGLALLDALPDRQALQDYPPLHSARAELYRRAGRVEAARTSYALALRLARQEPERRYLERRLAGLPE